MRETVHDRGFWRRRHRVFGRGGERESAKMWSLAVVGDVLWPKTENAKWFVSVGVQIGLRRRLVPKPKRNCENSNPYRLRSQKQSDKGHT